VLGAHFGAMLLSLAVPIAWWLRFGLATLIGVSLWRQWRYGAWAASAELRLEKDGFCIQSLNGEQLRYRITRATAHAGFVRLTLQRAGRKTQTLLVPRDAVEPGVFRDLRARIVQRRLPVPEQDPA
jgi:hypothetical protein